MEGAAEPGQLLSTVTHLNAVDGVAAAGLQAAERAKCMDQHRITFKHSFRGTKGRVHCGS